MSGVSIDDAVAMIQYVMKDDSLQGPVNFVTPNVLNNGKFTKSLGQVSSRPTIFPLPIFVACIALGEMANKTTAMLNKGIKINKQDNQAAPAGFAKLSVHHILVIFLGTQVLVSV